MHIPSPIYYQRILPDGVHDGERADFTTELIVAEAEKLGIAWKLIAGTDVIRLEYKSHVEFFRNRSPSTSHSPGLRICQNKISTAELLKLHNISVVKGFAVFAKDADEVMKKIWDGLIKPIVLKPTHGTHGDAVFVGITEWEDCLNKIHRYFSHPLYSVGGMLLEEMFVGHEYRIMATREKVIGILERIPAHVIGDGNSTVQELIDQKNQDPLRNISESLYPHILVDEDMLEILTQQGKELTTIPRNQEKIILRKVSNVMAGGDSVDLTDQVHQSVKDIALQAIQAIPGLSWGGVDFMTADINAPQTPESYRIIEINAAPEFDMHQIPMYGEPRPVAKEFLQLMFPEISG